MRTAKGGNTRPAYANDVFVLAVGRIIGAVCRNVQRIVDLIGS